MIYNAAQRKKQSNTIKGKGNPNWKGGRITKACIRCGSPFFVHPSTENREHCSLACANRDTAEKQRGIVNPLKIQRGAKNGCWRGGPIGHKCAWCGKEFETKRCAFGECCSRSCAAKFQYSGAKQYSDGKLLSEWREAILNKDKHICKRCGDTSNLEVHHIKPYASYPELRYVVGNGITLCRSCHGIVEYGGAV